jgi:SsrA-binding protein
VAYKTIVKNRKAWHDYEILEKFEAGISLAGTEVKSLRIGRVKLAEAFCQIDDRLQMELHEMEISPYTHGNIHNHRPTRVRRLLMHKREINRLLSKVKEKGLTLIPLSLYFKGDNVKVEVALCKGKKLHDKRAALKDKDAKLEIARAMKLR